MLDGKYLKELTVDGKKYSYCDFAEFLEDKGQRIEEMPYTIRILLELALRKSAEKPYLKRYLEDFIDWDEKHDHDVVFKPERVVLQDLTGVPAMVDLASMRDEMKRRGGDVETINPDVSVHMVVDHSVQVDSAGNDEAFDFNVKREFERNNERYTFLKWAQNSFDNFKIIPPDTGIIHQVNLEYLSPVINQRNGVLFPDTLVGTDSHTTMINGLGVLGWGVGGIEAEVGMLGQESYFPLPKVVGVKLTGKKRPGVTATDLALTLTNLLRKHNVVGKFVEYYGDGLKNLPLADRATIANMAPEYGATCGYFRIDDQTIEYLKLTDRPQETIDLVEAYAEKNHLHYQEREDSQRHYSEYVELDLSTVKSSVAGPSRPQDLVTLDKLPDNFRYYDDDLPQNLDFDMGNEHFSLRPGALGLAAITSCTNTSNPEVLICAGLLAKRAIERGLKVPAYVKTSLSPGSRVVTEYLKASGLQPYLDKLGFNLTGYGCMTCIGNSGRLKEEVAVAVEKTGYPLAAVESGNRNFEGRVNPLIKDTYLASPPMVVAYALAGTLDIDLEHQPLGKDSEGKDVYLKEIWPEPEEITDCIHNYVKPELFSENYNGIFKQNKVWNRLVPPVGETYEWDEKSTYLASAPFFDDKGGQAHLSGLRVLAKLGDTITTDHISPAGFIGPDTPAGRYLKEHDVAVRDFNSYGSRRGNHEVMVRGTLANIRLKNKLAKGKSGGFTYDWLDEKDTTIYEAAMNYRKHGIGSVVLAGKDYGMGSSRDWAAKGVKLLGVKAVIAESFERIHRSNLVMMGVLPLQYLPGENADSLGLDGSEAFEIELEDKMAHVTAKNDDHQIEFEAKVRFDAPIDEEYYKTGGILQYVLEDK